MINSSMVEALPFAFTLTDETPVKDRGYGLYPSEWDYDPRTQVSGLLTMGESSPTTMSSVASTGIFNDDSDRSTDDTGKD
jgi:hypothetical protein